MKNLLSSWKCRYLSLKGKVTVVNSLAISPLLYLAVGALVCMSRRDIPVCPGDVIICRRSCAEPGFGLFAAHFLPHDVTFSINRGCQVPPCGGNWNMYTSRSSGQNALRTWPWSFLSITRCCFTLCKEWISFNSFLCIYNKNCHQANGDNRHLVPNVPRGLDQDIRDMPIACARTHPHSNKHARHIPMYRPVHSGHANKCSPCLVICTVSPPGGAWQRRLNAGGDILREKLAICAHFLPRDVAFSRCARRRLAEGVILLTTSSGPGDGGATSRGALFRTEMGTFLFWAVHWGMSDRYIVEFARLVYCYYCLTDLSKSLRYLQYWYLYNDMTLAVVRLPKSLATLTLGSSKINFFDDFTALALLRPLKL